MLWPFQQLGVLVVGPIAALVAACFRRFRLALLLLVATVAKLVLERAVKAVVTRRRPATSIGPDVELRGDVSRFGESFVSGHAVLITAIAGLITPYLPGRWKIVPWVVVVLVAITRVYVGAHNPLDVICGAALGLVIAGVLNLLIGVPAPSGPVGIGVLEGHRDPSARQFRVGEAGDQARLIMWSAAIAKYSRRRSATSAGAPDAATASAMCPYQASRSARPTANGAWRMRRRGWPRWSL